MAKFELKDLPNALIGVFGIRTESELPFELVSKEGPFEVRLVARYVEAIHSNGGTRSEATDRSFGVLLDYIKGANSTQKKYSMSVPVFEEKIDGKWQTSFYIPGDLLSTPTSVNSEVSVKQKDSAKIASYRFSGSAKDGDVESAKRRLADWLSRHNLKAVGKFRLAQFDPPFAIGFLRRNEIHVAVV